MSESRDNFGLYASYYDLLYRDKDYQGEVDYLHALISQRLPSARAVLNLGSGTGRHDRLLAEKGYKVTGVDLSQQMVDIATASVEGSSLPVNFVCGDAREVRLEDRFDVVLSLFHVFSYQTSNQDLRKALVTAFEHLNPGGYLMFDCWYGPGVLSDPPVVRVKRLEDETVRVTRLAEPVHHPSENIIDVNYELQFQAPGGPVKVTREKHRMRYLFVPEVKLLADLVGFEVESFETWLQGGEPGLDTWNALFILKKPVT